MENLEELYNHSTEIKTDTKQFVSAFDYADGLVCAVNNKNLIIYEENNPTDTGTIYQINTTGILRYVKYLSIYNTVFLATIDELILYDIEKSSILVSVSVENSIVELSWNPLETLFVVIHTDYTVSSYMCTKYVIDLKDTSSLNANVPVPVLAGWGSINTQFQGPKKLKKGATLKETMVPSASDANPKISWRGNSELFVVNYFLNNQRFIKVFDSDLHALNQSEPYVNLQEQVAFMGQGQCIACCIQNNQETKLVIFEKNCKVKAEYDMPEIMGPVTKMQYHPQMNILAISYTKDTDSFLNIYLFSNGRWLLKQQLYYPSTRKILNFQWLNLQENLFTTCKIVVFTSKSIEYNYYRFVINRCPNTATVAVVNGKTIDFSLFDRKIIPPPLCYYSYEHEIPVNRILFHPTRNFCILIDSLFQIKILKLTETEAKVILSLNEYKVTDKVNFHKVNWTDEGLEVVLRSETVTDDISTKNDDISIVLKTENTSPCILLPYSDTNLILPYKNLDESNKCIYLTKHVVKENDNVLEFEFSLSAYRDFFINGNIVCSGVTSFYVYKNYLIFTHSNSKLYCVRLRDHILYTTDINLNKIFSREIEQGGVIVACTNLISPQIILQMPRGNLETVGCKMITIDVVEDMLRENKWKEVLHILRIEKVNWNVLIDLNPEWFHSHIEDFVKAAKNNTILTNIVTEFCVTDNCFETLYENYSFDGTKCYYNKKSIINDILLYLVSTDCVNNLSSIVAIQQKHISLKAALKSIKDIYNSNQQHEEVCSRVLRQLLIQEHFKDVENAAYNLFDLDFLSLVYRNSLEDPKVYEPEIETFKKMGVIERKFKMSLRGRNLTTAVKFLLRWEVVDEEYITNFIVKNHLSEAAYFSVDKCHRYYVLVSHLYAKTLSTLQKHDEAGMVLKKAELYKEALLEYRKGLEWREVIGLCSILNYKGAEQEELFKDLAVDLIKAKKIEDAVILLETYKKDYRSAIHVLVEQNIFRRAVTLAEIYKEYDLIESQIIPQLKSYMSLLMEKIENFTKQFEKYCSRLKIVREERIAKLYRVSMGLYDDQDDLYSDSSSQAPSSSSSRVTSRSRGTTLSSRNRRKEERKKIDLKEGGFYEDIALIRALHILYGEIFNFGEEIKDICLVGYLYDADLAKQLHKQLSELQDNTIERIPLIWSESFMQDDSSDYEVLAITQNKQDLDPEYRIPPSASKAKTWRLEIFS